MEPWRVDDAQSRGEGSKWSHGGSWALKIEGVEAHDRAVEDLYASGFRFASLW
jgi:hypothetical protein